MKDNPKKRIEEIHIEEIQNGDTILCRDGEIRTLNENYIKRGGFLGTSIWGDSYCMGNIKVKKITIAI